ncbi:MAG: hypothetical protein ACR2P9_05185 [Gammaproteobacteria bacterium]
MSYAAIKFLHILLLVFWLGTDLGVLLLSKKFRDSTLSVETRITLLQMAMIIDVLPRICFIIMLPVGVHLANAIGVLDVGALELAGLWLLALVLLAVNMAAAKNMGNDLGVRLQRLNWLLLGLTGLVLIVAGLLPMFGGSPVIAPWLAAKLTIYGLIYWLAIGIDWAFMPIGKCVAELLEKGSSPALEQNIAVASDKSVVYVYAVYLAVAAAAFIGVAKPAFLS